MKSIAMDAKTMKTILSCTMDALLVVDSDGFISLANRSAESLFLVREGGLIGRQVRGLISDQQFKKMLENVFIYAKEVFIETKNQSDSEVLRVHSMPVMGDDSKVEGAVVVFRDVTDARNFAQMRSEFAGNVSHELRTPLTSIKGFVETLLDGAAEDPASCRRFLTIIDAESYRLNRLIEDLLTLASIESKERMITPNPFCMVRSARSVMNMLGPQISEKKLQVELIYNPDLPMIFGDGNLINQVLINLLDNAIKYTPRGGKITIRCKQQETRMLFTVSDTGIGIPQESIPRVFERFYRVDKARSRNMGGTGLGLSIVKHIVESHGGEVFVNSEIGKGSTFGVSFLVT
jgi:two-component system phosphate regulon sensor histidine kinase PhoR